MKKNQAEETATNEINEVATVAEPVAEQPNPGNESGEDSEDANESDFVPRRIGEENVKMVSLAQKAYEILIEAANSLKGAVESSLKRKITIDELLQFIKSESENWVYSQYVEDNDIRFPGLSLEKIIELELLDITGVPEVIKKKAKLQSAVKLVEQSGFYYPLRLLYSETTNDFDFTGDFWEVCETRFSRFTQTAEQNKILLSFENLEIVFYNK
jgi:hypothetical protein